MRVRRLGEGSSYITYDYKNSSMGNNFLIKFQNFCRKHFLVTLYITFCLKCSDILSHWVHCLLGNLLSKKFINLVSLGLRLLFEPKFSHFTMWYQLKNSAIFQLISYEPLTSLPHFCIWQNRYISSLLVYSQRSKQSIKFEDFSRIWEF